MGLDTLEEGHFNWREYLDMVIRHKWVMITPIILAVIIATGVAYSLPKIYQASTLILVEDQRLLNPLVEGLAVSTNVADRLNALREELLSWPRLVQLIEKLGLDKNIHGPISYERLVMQLKNNIDVKMKNTNVIVIAHEDQDPQHAQDVVRTISEILIERNMSSRKTEANEAIQFIKHQLEIYRVKLEKSENELRRFKEIYTVSLPVAAKVNQQIIDLEIQLNTLLIECTDEHPAVLALRKKIEQLKGDRERELMQMEEKGLDTSSKEFQEISYSVPRQQQELARLQRDMQVNEALYEKLLERLENARISKTLDNADDTTKFKVIEPPRLPINPIKPKKERIILIGLGVGIALGCGIVFLIESSNTSLRNLEEAKRFLQLPVLGAISPITIEGKLLRRIKKNKRVSQSQKEVIDVGTQSADDEVVTDQKSQPSKESSKFTRYVKGVAKACGLI